MLKLATLVEQGAFIDFENLLLEFRKRKILLIFFWSFKCTFYAIWILISAKKKGSINKASSNFWNTLRIQDIKRVSDERSFGTFLSDNIFKFNYCVISTIYQNIFRRTGIVVEPCICAIAFCACWTFASLINAHPFDEPSGVLNWSYSIDKSFKNKPSFVRSDQHWRKWCLPENCAFFYRSVLAKKSSDVLFCLCLWKHSDKKLSVFFSVVVFALVWIYFRFRLGPHLRFYFTILVNPLFYPFKNTI